MPCVCLLSTLAVITGYFTNGNYLIKHMHSLIIAIIRVITGAEEQRRALRGNPTILTKQDA